MNAIKRLGALLLTCLLPFLAAAQMSGGGAPHSFSSAFRQRYLLPDLRPVAVDRVDVRRAMAEEQQYPGSRFTTPAVVDLGLENAGQWQRLADGGALWRLEIRSRDALGLAFLYDELYLPPGATLFMYSPDRRQVLGAYTHRNNSPGGRFMTGLIEGESAVLEYFEPAAAAGQGRLHLFRVDRAYRADFRDRVQPSVSTRSEGRPGFGSALDCHDNANCPAGDDRRDQQRGVCRILVVVEEGIGYCTGTVLNNTRQDGTPYVLTGFHCQDGYKPLYDFWRFDFNYEGPSCDQPAVEPAYKSVLGARRVAGRQQNDFLLLELTNDIPFSYDVFFCGWNRQSSPPAAGLSFHHPVGDIKKVSTIQGPIRVFNGPITWNNGVATPAGHHFDLDYSTGTFEVGSSGTALFNPAGLVVGQLHGGNPSCEQTQAWYGRLSLAWDGGGTPETRLKDWLDPLGSGPMTLEGIENPVKGSGTMAGLVFTEDDRPVAGVEVTLDGPEKRTALTDAAGNYSFGAVPFGEVYSLSFDRGGLASNGLSTLDLIRVRKHILGIERIDSPYKMLAADVNASGSITTLDIIKIQKVILGVRSQFEEVPSWRFLPLDLTFADPLDPFKETIPEFYVLTDFVEELPDLDFIAIKSGDVNNSADPQQ